MENLEEKELYNMEEERNKIIEFLDENHVHYNKDDSLTKLYLIYINTLSILQLSNIDTKCFGPAENSSLQRIIDKCSVEPKDNFFDYYK